MGPFRNIGEAVEYNQRLARRAVIVSFLVGVSLGVLACAIVVSRL